MKRKEIMFKFVALLIIICASISAIASTYDDPAASSTPNTGNHFGVLYGTDGSIEMELTGASGVAGNDPLNGIQTILQKYKKIGVAIAAVCIITAILSLLIQITKLGAAGDNEQMRLAALKGIIYSGAVIAVFGALTLVIGIIWNVLA